MEWLAEVWEEVRDWWPLFLTLLGLAVDVGMITWVLMTKTNSTSAVAWCMVILVFPFLGALFFILFGYQHIDRPLRRKRRHKALYRLPPYPPGHDADSGRFVKAESPSPPAGELTVAQRLALLANRFGAYPLTTGNRVEYYFDGQTAFPAMLEAIAAAKHHVHVEFFIFHGDGIGKEFLSLLAKKAREGVQVRFLYDAIGSRKLSRRDLEELRQAGGKISQFLPINLFRRRFQINMRNHRKILVVDGEIGFVGGLNIGDEYRGMNPRYGYWRDAHMRLQGPVVGDVQRVFAEDWDFSSDERIVDAPADAPRYFKAKDGGGDVPMQVIDSGPDREIKGIREIYFAAILKARKRVWIASPYFIPDAGLLDALRLAGHLGVDVRLLNQFRPDHWIPQYCAHYYWNEVFPAGVKIYQYARGMMHSKMILVDGEWATVGTANLDNRSMHLNFEVNCLIYSPQEVAKLEGFFLRDLRDSIRLDAAAFRRRPFARRLLENACRLLSPVL